MTNVRLLVVVSFVALSVGFAAGWWVARQEPGAAAGGRAPHAVGVTEHLELGSRALESGDLAGAERHFRDAVAAEPGSARARVDLAAALMLQGRWTDAHPELATAARAEPEMPDVWFLTGLLWRDGFADSARAREAWERFLAIVPEDSHEAGTVRGWLSEMENVPSERD